MSAEPFNSIGGYTVGIPAIDVVDNNGNIVTNVNYPEGNVTANRIFANSYFYANGDPFSGSGTPGGSNTELQFNNDGQFGGIPNVTYDGNILSLGDISTLSILGGSANYFLQTDGNGNLTWALGGNGGSGLITVRESNSTGGNISNTITNISTLNFDKTTGIFVSDLGNGNALVALGSSFKTWEVNGQPSLVAVGEDTVEFITGNNIVITTSNVSDPKSITFSVSAGLDTQVLYNNSGNIVGSNNFTYNNTSNTLSITGNVVASNVRANSFQFSNGVPIAFAVVGGSNTQVQFNDDGNLNGTTNFTFNKQTSVLSISGSINSLNANLGNSVVGNYFIGNGAFLTSLPAANLVGSVPLAAQVSEASQPNITSVGTLTSLIVVGNISTFGNVNAANLSATGNITGANANVTGILTIPVSGQLSVAGNVNFTSSGNVSLGSISNVKILGGTSGQVLSTDGTGNLSWITGGGGGSPGGGNTQIQFNDNGVFGGNAALTFNKNTNNVQIAGNLIANSFTMGAGVYKFCTSNVYAATTSSPANNQIIFETPAANLSGLDFHIISTDVPGNIRQISKISAVVLGSAVNYNEYSSMGVNGYTGDFTVGYSPGNIFTPAQVVLYITPQSGNLMTHKMMITAYEL